MKREIFSIHYDKIKHNEKLFFAKVFEVGVGYTIGGEGAKVEKIESTPDGFTIFFDNGWTYDIPLTEDVEIARRPIKETDANRESKDIKK